MEQLKNLIKKRLNELEVDEIPELYTDLYDIYNSYRDKPYYQYDSYDMMGITLLLMVNEVGYNELSEIRKVMHDCTILFSKIITFPDFYVKYFKKIKNLIKTNELNKINNFTEKKDEYSDEANDFISDNIILLNAVFEDTNNKDKSIEKMIKLFKLCPNPDVIGSFQYIDLIQEEYQKNLDESELFDLFFESKSKNIHKSIRKKVYSKVSKYVEKVDSYIKTIENNNQAIHENYRKKKTKYNKTKNNYNTLIKKINNQKGYIENIDEYLNLIENDEIQAYVLDYILKYNSKFERSLQEENKKLLKIKDNNIDYILFDYNITNIIFSDEQKDELIKLDDLKKKLSFLEKSTLKNMISCDILYTLLINLDLFEFSFLIELVNNKVIDYSLVEANIEKIKDKNSFDIFYNNVKFLQKYIKNIVKYDDNILFETNDIIKKRYQLLKVNYGIKLDRMTNFEFLLNDSIFDLLDKFIELGFYDVIRKYPDYLNSNGFLMIKRLEIAKMIDLQVLKDDGAFINSIVTGKNFYVSDNDLDNYIIDDKFDYINILEDKKSRLDIDSDLEPDVIKKYINKKYYYQIGDQILSRNRFLRNLKKFGNDKLLESMLFGAINLSSDEIEQIIEELNGKQKIMQ